MADKTLMQDACALAQDFALLMEKGEVQCVIVLMRPSGELPCPVEVAYVAHGPDREQFPATLRKVADCIAENADIVPRANA